MLASSAAADALGVKATGIGNELASSMPTAGSRWTRASAQLDNQGGTLQATGSVSANGTGLNNQGGVIAAIGQVTAHAGSGTLTNTGGLVTGQNITIGGAVNNSAGVISGSNSVAMTTLALNNDAGVIESGTGGISIDTQGNTLTNTNSGATRGIVSQGAISHRGRRHLNNQGGSTPERC